MPLIENQVSTQHRRRIGKFWRWAIPAALAGIAVPVVVVQIAIARAGPILKGRVVETLRARFGSEVQLDTLQVSIVHGVDNIVGTHLSTNSRGNGPCARACH